jgi:hypothetical protein
MRMQKKYASQRICMPKRMHVLMSMKQKNRNNVSFNGHERVESVYFDK